MAFGALLLDAFRVRFASDFHALLGLVVGLTPRLGSLVMPSVAAHLILMMFAVVPGSSWHALRSDSGIPGFDVYGCVKKYHVCCSKSPLERFWQLLGFPAIFLLWTSWNFLGRGPAIRRCTFLGTPSAEKVSLAVTAKCLSLIIRFGLLIVSRFCGFFAFCQNSHVYGHVY